MSRKFFVFKKYSKRNRRGSARKVNILGGKAELYERPNPDNRLIMRKIVSRIHNDEEHFLQKQTTFKQYKRYFLCAIDSRFTRC